MTCIINRFSKILWLWFYDNFIKLFKNLFTFFSSLYFVPLQGVGERDLNRFYLPIAEEQTDKCMVINSNVAPPSKVNLDDFKFDKELEQISQDSGNYFIDDIIMSGDNESNQSSELKAV